MHYEEKREFNFREFSFFEILRGEKKKMNLSSH